MNRFIRSSPFRATPFFNINTNTPYHEIFSILDTLLQQKQAGHDSALVSAYWQVGQYIVMNAQRTNPRAFYRSAFLQELSTALTAKYGKGFSRQSIINMRKLFIFSPIRQSAFNGPLTWTHYTVILSAASYEEVFFYKEQAE